MIIICLDQGGENSEQEKQHCLKQEAGIFRTPC
jgi:hypothetical protein